MDRNICEKINNVLEKLRKSGKYGNATERIKIIIADANKERLGLNEELRKRKRESSETVNKSNKKFKKNTKDNKE